MTIWNDVDAASSAIVNGPAGAITSLLLAVPDNDTVKLAAGCVAGVAFTTNVAGWPLLTTLAVDTMVSVGVAAGPTSPVARNAALVATVLPLVAAARATGGASMVRPADVCSPSW